MSAKGMLAGLVGGTALLVLLAASWPSPRYVPDPEPSPVVEGPLSRDAARQIIGEGGALGPVFEGYRIGGPMPPPAVRDRIAQFARANHAAIELEASDGMLHAVQLSVTYGGCCGYLEADWIAAHFGRRHVGPGCMGQEEWIDHLVMVDGDVHVRADVHINHVDVRWTRVLSTADILSRAQWLFGQDPAKVAPVVGRDWIVAAGHRYLVTLPYPFTSSLEPGLSDRGMSVSAEDGAIDRIEFTITQRTDDTAEIEKALRARWGRPRTDDSTWTWRFRDRVITAELSGPSARIYMQTPRLDAIDRP